MPLHIEFVNRSGQPVTLGLRERNIRLDDGWSETVLSREVDPLTIQRGRQRLIYKVPDWPAEGVEHRGFKLYGRGLFNAKRVFPVHIDSGGYVWAAAKNERYSFAIDGSQPQGFPLAPSAT